MSVRLLLNLGVVLATLAVQAQLPAARLNWVFPAGAARGTTQEVSVGGSDLDEPVRLIVSDPRITASPASDGSPRFTVIVPPDIPCGLVDVRFQGRFGVSNPRAFQIGADPEQVVNPTNTTAPSALGIPLDTVLNGRVPPASMAWFRFSARKGQQLLISAACRELDSRLLADLAVLTEVGHELGIARRGQVLDFTAPESGVFHLRLSDQTFRGGDDYLYRLCLSTRPRIEFALPLSLTEGSPVPVTVFGRHLPGGQPSTISGSDGHPLECLTLPGPAAVRPTSDGFALSPWILQKPAAAASATDHIHWAPEFDSWQHPPLVFALTPLPTVWNLSNQWVRVTPPVDFSGAFPRRGERSGVEFEAKKDQVYWIEVFSDRLGFTVDPHLVIQRVRRNDQGGERTQDLAEFADLDKNLGGRDFDTVSRDAGGRFQVPEDGTYRVLVRDLLRSGSRSPRLPYRLEVRPESPDFQLAFFPQPPPRRDDNDRQIHLVTPALRRGGILPLQVIALRRDGFEGPIDLQATGLPTGVTACPARIPMGQTTTTLFLAADTNAPASVGGITLEGRARVKDQDLVRVALAASGRWHVQDWNQEWGNPRFTGSFPLAVITAEEAPIALHPSTAPPLEAPVKGRIALPITIARQPEFQGAFKLKPFGHPALDKAKETEVPEKATQVVVELDLGEIALPEGEHLVHLEGTVAGKYRDPREPADKAKPKDVSFRVYSPPVLVRVTPPSKAG